MLFKNRSDISFDIEAFVLNISINGTFVGVVRQGVNQKIAANGESMINFDVDATMKNLVKKPLLLGKLIQYYITKNYSKIIITIDGSVIIRHKFVSAAVPIKKWDYKLSEFV